MPYVPNADDLTQPTEDKELVSAAAEFRTLKAKVESNQDRIDTLEGSALQVVAGEYLATAPVDMAGYAISNAGNMSADIVTTDELVVGGFTFTPGDFSPDIDAALRGDLATTGAGKGAEMVASDDGAGGSLWTTVAGFITRLRSSAGSALVGFIQSGTGAIARPMQDKARDFVSVRDFGAVGNGLVDDTAAIQAALNVHNHVYVEPGTYRCDGMIELNQGKTLQVAGGATLVRLSASSSSTDPVVWIKNRFAALIGAGQHSSIIKSENRVPRGVVRLGHKDMTESHAGVFYCTLRGFNLQGGQGFGRTTGDPDVGLYMANPQFGNVASYFHNVSDLRIQDFNIGIWLHGWANGNTFTNIQGDRIGNITLGPDKNVFIYCNGALDNSATNCQFHGSANSIGLLVDILDNTANGGAVHTPQANSWSNMVFEQTGSNAIGLKAVGTTNSSFYEIRSNVNQGNSVPANFTDTNILIQLQDFGARRITGTEVTAKTAYRGLGSFQVGTGTRYLSSRKVKLGNAANAATVSFTLSIGAEGAVWRFGFARITVAGGDNGLSTSPVAWYLYKLNSLNTLYPVLGDLVDSGGNTASFTITNPSNGVITISSTEDSIVADLDCSFGTSEVLVT